MCLRFNPSLVECVTRNVLPTAKSSYFPTSECAPDERAHDSDHGESVKNVDVCGGGFQTSAEIMQTNGRNLVSTVIHPTSGVAVRLPYGINL